MHYLFLLVAIFVGSLLPAQSTPYKLWSSPTWGSSPVFLPTVSEQVGYVSGAQASQSAQIPGFVDYSFWTGHYASGSAPWGTSGHYAVSVGHQYVSAALTWNVCTRGVGSYIPFFSLEITFGAASTWISAMPSPPASSGWGTLFTSPFTSSTVLAPFAYTVDAGVCDFEQFLATVDIPNGTSFLGYVLNSQWLRIDPVDGQLYGSVGHSTFIGL